MNAIMMSFTALVTSMLAVLSTSVHASLDMQDQPDDPGYYEEEYYDYGYQGGYAGYRGDPDGLNNFNGTYEYDGRTESFYSGDNAAYRGDLWVDEDGFYRTEEGYYAVATSGGGDDPSIGETFEGSQGTCVVVDDGASPGVTDYAVSGWY